METRLEERIAAREQADAILLNYTDLPKGDAARIRTILIEAILFERPVRQMQISINDVGAEYNIIILGYRNIIDDVRWVNTFFGSGRQAHDDLVAVLESHTLFSDTAKILKVEKLRFVTAVPSSKRPPLKRRFQTRTE